MSKTARRGWAGRGSTYRWKQVRKLILARDGFACQIAGPKCTGGATEVDHVVALADGGAHYDPSNLRASCATCNRGRAGGTTYPRYGASQTTDVETRTVW
jgi:5-methylcytosine-specific restriction endonuclease McrA